jgi:diguanylate cyclase (GGDEF)-like protein
MQPSWCSYTGQTAESGCGFGWLDSIDPSDRTSVAHEWTSHALDGVPFRLTAKVWHASSGTFHLCTGQVVPVHHEESVTDWVAALIDTQHAERTDELERAMATRFRRIFAANVFGIGYGELDRIVDGNDAFLDAIGVKVSDLSSGVCLTEVFGCDNPSAEILTEGAAREYEIRRSDGTLGHVLAAGVSLTPEPGWLAFTVDLTPRKAAERAMAHLALHDPLTGLPNRRLLEDRLEHALSLTHRRQGTVAVLFCDVDHFKDVNDAHGHRGGDEVLRNVARRLETVVRDNDTVARAGGDEFVVVLEDLVDPTEATRVAERARLALNEPIPLDAVEVRVSVSVGVSLNANPDDNVDSLLRRADDALYQAKRRGRDQIAFADDELTTRGRPR